MPIKHQVVVITDTNDAHIPFVQQHLAEQLYILDPHTLLSGGKLSYELHQGKCIVSYNNELLNSVAGVWYRRPGEIYSEHIDVDADFKDYSASAISTLTRQLRTCFEDAVWISDYFAIQRASNKSWQLQIAAQLGLPVPATLMTSDTNAAQNFITHHDRIIVKPLAAVLPNIKGVVKIFYASLIDSHSMPDLSNLHLAPAIFQQAIDASCDIRVIVVGNEVFAAIIHPKNQANETAVRDWRINQFDKDLRIEPYDLSPSMTAQCIKLVKKLGLRYGAIDLVRDKRGKLWFLENNANGQWAFVEQYAGQPIGKAIATLLSNPLSK